MSAHNPFVRILYKPKRVSTSNGLACLGVPIFSTIRLYVKVEVDKNQLAAFEQRMHLEMEIYNHVTRSTYL